MASNDETGSYPATHWSLIGQAAGNDQAARDALGALLRTYLVPMRMSLGKFRIDQETAEDIVQGFLLHKVLEKELLKAANKDKGRFRDFLRVSLQRYAVDVLRRKRRDSLVSNAAATLVESQEQVDIFEEAWASQVLQQAVSVFHAICRESDREDMWEMFCRRVIDPIVQSQDPVDFATLASKLGLPSLQQVYNLFAITKRRFRTVMESVIREYELDVEGEFREIRRIFAASRKVAFRLSYEGMASAVVQVDPTVVGTEVHPSLHGILDMSDPPLHSVELRALFRELMSRSIELEVVGDSATAAARLKKLASAQHLLLKSLGDLFAHSRPPLDLLDLAKSYAKVQLRDPQRVWPIEICQVVYYVAIAAAQTKCDTRLTELDDDSLIAGFQWALHLEWVDAQSKQILRSGLAYLTAGA